MPKSKSFGTGVTVGATAILGLTDISISGGDVPFVDLTTHDSTAKEFASGLVDNGTLELSGKLNHGDAGQDALRAGTGTSASLVITLASTISFSAIIGVMSETIPLEGTVDFSISCKITGSKTYSAS